MAEKKPVAWRITSQVRDEARDTLESRMEPVFGDEADQIDARFNTLQTNLLQERFKGDTGAIKLYTRLFGLKRTGNT